jgi:hypothetical protein
MRSNEPADAARDDSEEATPLCPRCLRPIDPLQHYCDCGQPVGQFTPYIPFVNIRFNYGVFGASWRRLWASGTALPPRLGHFLLIALLAPVMFIGVPFVLRDWWRSRRQGAG